MARDTSNGCENFEYNIPIVLQNFINFGVYILVSFSLLTIPFAGSFNIDEEYPIVIKNSYHDPSAHFGITVNLLKRGVTQVSSADRASGWILIGAPKGDSPHPEHSNISEPGVIWRCALGRANGSKDDCQIMHMDPTNEYDPKYRHLPHKDKKDEGWLGGAMYVGQSDRFVACGSKWLNQKFKGSYLMNGICYWVPANHVTYDKINETWPWLPPKESYRLSGLLNKNRQITIVKDNTSDPFNEWKYGQMGFSISIPDNNEMILGAPGVYEWTGSVVQFKDAKEPRQLYKRFNVHPSSQAFSELFVANMQSANGTNPFLNQSDYFGYAVAAGKFFKPELSQNRTQYVAGAPRSSSLSGKVLVFSFTESNEYQTATLDYLTDPIELNEDQDGRYASYFGSVMAAVDVNNDGFDDLIIGAPLFGKSHASIIHISKPVQDLYYDDAEEEGWSSAKKEFGSIISGDEGCIFIYLSTRNDFNRAPQELCGDKISGARFGTSISSIGDINIDGYNDIAVGAPYENGNRGAVYIYHGGESLMLAQKLLPEYIDPNLRTFGYSLSPGVDIDGNHYPDLAVGAYQSNTVVVFRTIPLVKFEPSLTSSIPKLLSSTHQLNITSCISFSGLSLPDALWLKLRISVEHEARPTKRLLTWVLNDIQAFGNISNMLHPQMTLDKFLSFRKEGTCYNFTAQRIGDVDVLAKAVTIKQVIWIHNYDKSPFTQPIVQEIFKDSGGKANLNFDKSQSKFHDFYTKKLPISMNNEMSTSSLSLPIGTICEADGDPVCLADLRINPVFRDKTGMVLDFFVLGSSESLKLEIELWNEREIAHLPIMVDITWNSPPTLRMHDGGCIKIKDKNQLVQAYRCNITKPIKVGKMETIQMELDMKGLYVGEIGESIAFTFNADSASELVKQAEKLYELRLEHTMDLRNYSYEEEMPYENYLESGTFNFSQAYEINLVGPSPIHAVRMELNIPKLIEINGETHELLLVRTPLVTYDGAFRCTAVNGSFVDEHLVPTSSIFTKAELFIGTTENPLSLLSEDISSDESLSGYDEYDENGTFIMAEADSTEKIMRRKLRRNKRQAIEQFYQIFNLDHKVEDDNELDALKIYCGSPEVTCMKVVCEMTHFHDSSKSVIEFKLRLQNEVTKTLLETHYSKESIWIESTGELLMIDQTGEVFGSSSEIKVTTKLLVPEAFDIPAWILITSIAGGILVLTLIIASLAKCGFFRRQKMEELLVLKNLKAQGATDDYFKL